MKLRILLVAAFLSLLPVMLLAQEITPWEFRNADFKMKSQYWKYLQERQESGILLDQTDFDVTHWTLDINVTDIAGETIFGYVTMTSAPTIDGLTEVDYDFHDNMDVDSVMMNGEHVTYIHLSHMLTIILDRAYNSDELFTTTVFYNGHPEGSGFGSFTWDSHNGQPMISTLSEPEGARDWWPCKDMPHDKADSADVFITVPDDLVATSNGVLVSDIDNGDGTRTFHWDISYPITTYLISLAITNYQSFTDWYVTDQGDSMPIVNYVFPEHYYEAVEDLNITADATGFYASLFGEYPFVEEKYGHSIFGWGGAMEHQCNTSYGRGLIRGDHAYDWILVHELAHMWFGDMISPDIWPEIWMNEGFASYCEPLWFEHLFGFESYHYYMTNMNSVSYPSGPIYDPDPLFDGNTVYNKGSWVLHMLRGVMGDEAFFEGMYAYSTDPEFMYGTITTREFQAVMEQYYGAELGWYFDEWIWGRNRPFYTYSWMDEDIGNGQFEVFLHIEQEQPPPAPEVFIMPIKVYPQIGGQDTVITVYNDSRIDDFRFIVNGNPAGLLFDKDDWILKFASTEGYGMNIVTTELPDAGLDIYYEATIEARGGQTPYSFNVQDGNLPSGLSLDGATGAITGIPDTEGEYAFTIRCTDSSNPVKTDDQDYVVAVEDQIDIENRIAQVPSNFALIGNYPNPFNNSTLISFRLGEPGYVSLDVYNMLGQKIASLHDGYLEAGQHDIAWNAASVSSGIYFYKLTAGENSAVKKMSFIK